MNANSAKLNDPARATQENRLTPVDKPDVPSAKMRNWLDAFEDRTWRNIVIGTPYLWMIVFFLLPFVFVLKISLAPMPVPKGSRFTPTIPVRAPPYGSSADGEL